MGIACGIHYPVPIHLQEAYADLAIPAGTFPVTERLAGEVLSLPIYPEMADSDVDNVCAAVAAFYGPAAAAGG
jgi:dTDP-4-amino-4,6-dideoxygalactose transaminase